jgi:LPXTG-site transpeptidase (sortase) family protein
MFRVRFLGPAVALLLAACGTAAAPRSPEATLPSLPVARAAASPAPTRSASAPPRVSPSPAPSSAAPRPAAAIPKELIIPAINVRAAVEHVGTTPDGAMDVPKDPSDVAWFEKGFRPGERGNAVIAGHLDSATDRAVFWDLNKLKPGDKVLVQGEDGSEHAFQVIGAETYPYDRAPLDKIFGPSDAPMLNLITCNGTFDRASRNYDKRLVVFTKAVPG